MKFALRKGWVILLFVLPFCVSCGDADLLDTNKWSDQIDGWNPSIKGAIAWGGFTVWDFLQDSTREDFQVEMDKDSNLVVRYTQEDIANIDIAEVFELKGTPIVLTQDLELTTALNTLLEQHGTVSISQPQKLSEVAIPRKHLPLPEEFAETKLDQIKLSKGTCTYSLSGFENLEYEITVAYESDGKDSVLLNLTESTVSKNVPLGNKIFDLPIHLKVNCTLKGGSITKPLSVEVTFSDYDFSMVRGKIVKAEGIKIDKGSFDVDMDILNDVDGTVWFADPEVELVLRNKGFGVPLGVDMSFVRTGKNGEEAKLSLDSSLLFIGNLSNTEIISDYQSVNKDNSNIRDFLASLSSGEMYYSDTVTYSGTVTVNPKKEDACVIYKDGSLGIDLNVVVPVSIDSSNLSYSKTVSNVNIDQKYADKIEKGTIVLHVQENALPLDLSIPKMILLDEYDRRLDTIAVTSNNEDGGKIKAKAKGSLSFELNEDAAKKLGKTRSILLEAAVSGGTGEPVKANEQLKFVLTLKATAAIKDFDDF